MRSPETMSNLSIRRSYNSHLPVLLKATALIMDEIIIVEYAPRWQTLFEEEAARDWKVLGNEMVIANGKSGYIQAVMEKARREQTLPNQTH